MFAVCANAAVLRVGPGQQYLTPCSAIDAAVAGDTIQIDAAGNYDGDVCGWTTNDLTICRREWVSEDRRRGQEFSRQSDLDDLGQQYDR